MKNNRPIFWHQGLFLQPQHLQLMDLYHQSLPAPVFQLASAFPYGVLSLKIDAKALQDRYLAVERAEILFPDGTMIDCPGNAVIPSRPLPEQVLEGRRSLKVYLGLRKWDGASANVTVVASHEHTAEVTTRFVTLATPEEVADLYQEGPIGRVKRLSVAAKLFWETEKDQLAHYHLLPVAELLVEGDRVALNPGFAPACLKVGASETLSAIAREIRDKVTARCLRLEEYKSPQGMKGAELEPGVFFLLMGLRAMSRYVAWLHNCGDLDLHHPQVVYQTLTELAGELSLFTKSMNAAGMGVDGSRRIPAYDHQNPGLCYKQMEELLEQLLDEITFGPEHVIRLNPDGPYRVGVTSPAVFSDRHVYYLSLRTAGDPRAVQESVERMAKLSARENLPILVSRALPGLGLTFVPVPPPGLPQLSSTVYFRIDTSSTQWEDVHRAGNIALAWAEAPEDLAAEVIVLRRS